MGPLTGPSDEVEFLYREQRRGISWWAACEGGAWADRTASFSKASLRSAPRDEFLYFHKSIAHRLSNNFTYSLMVAAISRCCCLMPDEKCQPRMTSRERLGVDHARRKLLWNAQCFPWSQALSTSATQALHGHRS